MTTVRRVLFCLAMLSFGSAFVMADVTGSILGSVRDQSSAVVPGVQVVATNLETGLTHQTITDAAGNYRLLALPAGRYRVEAAASGFEKFVANVIDLTVNEERRIDITLQVGNVEQSVQVNAAAVQVETTNTQLGDVVDEKKLLSLPLNGRSYIDLLGLQAGVVPVSGAEGPTDRPVSGNLQAGNLSVNGQRETSNAFLVNGGDVSEGKNFGTSIIPNLDSVAEFRLITNSFDAEYGRFSGAIMNAITKSGTNGFHGSAFEFLRNDDMDARGFFDPERALLKRNQFGYAVGGPAIKNKLFWFTDYQGTREVAGAPTGLVAVPTAAERAGDLSDLTLNGVVKGQYWAQVLSQRLGYTVSPNEPYSLPNCTSTLNCVFPGNIVPTRALSSAAVGTMKSIPLPNVGGDLFSSAGTNLRTVDDKMGQRVDFNSRRFGNWSGYYHFDDATVTNPLGENNLPGFPTVTPSRAQQAVLSNTYTFGPTAVNEFRLDYTRMAINANSPVGAKQPVSDFGFVTGANTLGIIPSGFPGFSGVPSISTLEFTFGTPSQHAYQFNNTYAISDSFSKVFGQHTLKFGGDFRYFQVNDRNSYAPVGQFSFDGFETGSDIADLLLGAPTQFTQSSTQQMDSRSRYGAAFAQDSYRIKPNLTLNYGLRWEVSMPWYDTQGRIQSIVPGEQSIVFPTSPRGWVFPGDPGVPSTLAPTNYLNFMPRLGLAYSPSSSSGLLGKLFGGPSKTSIRAAFGLYYTAVQDQGLFDEVGDAPFGLYWVSTSPIVFETPYLTRASGVSQVQRFPFVAPIPNSPANKTLDFSPYLPLTASNGYYTTNRLPYAEHFNFSIQRSITESMVLTLAYVGTEGHRLFSQMEANPGDAKLCLSLMGSGVMAGTQECGPNNENLTFTRPNGTLVYGTRDLRGLNPPNALNFASNQALVNIGSSAYHSFQTTLEKKASDFTFLAAYTFSKSLDDTSSFTYNYEVNFSNYRLSRGLSAFNMTDNFVLSYVYALPLDRAFRSAPRRLTQGWSINGITRFTTGFPISLAQAGDLSLAGTAGIDVPDIVGPVTILNPRQTGPSGPNQYFSTSSFASGPLGTFGDANRRFFSGPGFNNWDFGFHKDTAIREGMNLEFRAEFFNIFNHAQFMTPVGNFSSSQFGLVTSAQPPRIGQLALKFLW
jgi:hypothetical protein